MIPHVVILGAGISGLSCAWFLKKQLGSRVHVTVVEASHRPGGWIQTLNEEGFLFEQGPRSFRSTGTGKAVLQLIHDLQLDHAVIRASPAASRRYLYLKNSLHAVPRGGFEVLTSPWFWPFLTGLLLEPFQARGMGEEETVDQFVSRRCGTRVSQGLMDPLVAGICAGDIHQLSLKACFPRFYEWEQKEGSVLKGMWKHRERGDILSLQEGLESLIQSLVNKTEAAWKWKAKITGWDFNNRQIQIRLDQEILVADHVVCAVPSQTLEKWRGQSLEIPCASVAVVHLGYHKKSHGYEGFGYLIPSVAQEKVLGVVWDSSVFPQQNETPHQTRMTVMLGGTRMPEFQQYSSSDFIEMAREAIEEQMKIKVAPDFIQCHIASQAIPQYGVGHEKRIENLEKELKERHSHLHLLGHHFYGFSLGECVARAQRLAAEIASKS